MDDIKSIYGSRDYVREEAPIATNETPVVPSSDADYINSLLQQDKTKSKNLSEQREIINEQFKKNKELQQQYETLEAKYNDLLAKQTGDNYLQRIQTLESQLETWEADKKRQALIPIVELCKQYGVKQNDLKQVFNVINQQYGVDLTQNPNVELARRLIPELLNINNEPQTIPNGSYQVDYQFQQQKLAMEQEQKHYDAVNKRREQLLAYAEAQKNKFKR